LSASYDDVRKRGVAAFVKETGRDTYWRALTQQRASYLGSDGMARPDLLEDVACAACGGADARDVFVKDGFPYVRCLACGSIYIARQLRDEHLDAYWSTSPVAALWLDVLAAPAQLDFDRAKYQLALDELEKVRGGPGTLLDIGCSVGVFLDVARSRGWDVTGVEPGASARERAAAQFGLDVYADLADVGEETFDAVTFWEVVEHVKRPVELLAAARAALAPGGTVLTLVGGNVHALANRVMRQASAAFDFSRLWYFSPASYSTLLGRSGLEQTRYRSVIAEIDTTINYLRYDDPYDAVFAEPVLPPALLAALERAVLDGDLGYKFLSFAREPDPSRP
jgi:SAM-dependent methyltransferase